MLKLNSGYILIALAAIITGMYHLWKFREFHNDYKLSANLGIDVYLFGFLWSATNSSQYDPIKFNTRGCTEKIRPFEIKINCRQWFTLTMWLQFQTYGVDSQLNSMEVSMQKTSHLWVKKRRTLNGGKGQAKLFRRIARISKTGTRYAI